MKNNNFIIEKYPDEIAQRLYELGKDLDFNDYKENIKEEKKQLIDALYYIKTLAENELNPDYFRTLYRVLEGIQ